MMAATTTENPLTEGLERLPVPPTTLVIFGATGDLARRKLLPALYNLAHEGALPARFNLVGVSRRDQTDDEFRSQAREAIAQFSRRKPDEQLLDGLVSRGCATSGSRSTTLPATRSWARRWTRSTRRRASRSTASTTSRPRRSSSASSPRRSGRTACTTTSTPRCAR